VEPTKFDNKKLKQKKRIEFEKGERKKQRQECGLSWDELSSTALDAFYPMLTCFVLCSAVSPALPLPLPSLQCKLCNFIHSCLFILSLSLYYYLEHL
jgi:hypothetical protein